MQTDIKGLENIVKYIEATKLSMFYVHRADKGVSGIAVFECIDSDSNKEAVSRFKEWAAVVNNDMPYKISLFDFVEVTDVMGGGKKFQKANGKANKSECTFVINESAASQQTNSTTHNNGSFDLATLRADIIKEISKQQDENLILNEIKSLKAKFTELEEADDEDCDGDEINEGGVLGGINQNQVTQLMGLVNLFKNGSPAPASINGGAEKATDKTLIKENINKAIKTLYKHDKNLDTDLLKLAELAETKPETFNFLLTSLRTM